MNLNFSGTTVFAELWDELIHGDNDVIMLRGGRRSSKTYSILQCLLLIYFTQPGIKINIYRKTMPECRSTVLADMMDILIKHDLLKFVIYNKQTFTMRSRLNKSIISFKSLDDSQKARGTGINYCYMNECQQFTKEEYDMLMLSLSEPNANLKNRMILDFNPSDWSSWVKDLEDSKKCKVFTSSYRNNPFLDQSIINIIEGYKDTNPDFWEVFGNGEYSIPQNLIFRYTKYSNLPTNIEFDTYMGMDFGYTNDPTSCILGHVNKRLKEIYLRQIIYSRGLQDEDIVSLLREQKLDKCHISADSEDPKSIVHLKQLGLSNIQPAKKGGDSKLSSINILKGYKIFIHEDSLDLINEINNYKWKKSYSGQVLNIIDDSYSVMNHAMDAIRYLALNFLLFEKKKTDIRFT